MSTFLHRIPVKTAWYKLYFIHVNVGLDPSWYVQHVVVWDTQTDHMFFFLLEDWLSVENQKNGTVEKEVLASCKITDITFHLHIAKKM